MYTPQKFKGWSLESEKPTVEGMNFLPPKNIHPWIGKWCRLGKVAFAGDVGHFFFHQLTSASENRNLRGV